MQPDDLAGSLATEKQWQDVHRVNRGWSSDTKYHVVDRHGRELMLRISPGDQLERKQFEYHCLERVAEVGILMPQPVECCPSDDGRLVVTLLSWVDGSDLEMALDTISVAEQRRLGILAGTALASIHTLDGEIDADSWETHYRAKIDRVVRWYGSCGVRLPHGDRVVRYIHDHAHLLARRPIRLQHGDFHAGSLVLTPDRKIGVIDFDRCSYGDPWEEYDRFVFTWRRSAAFASGQIHGYFPDQVPDGFFPLLALYNAVQMVASIPWAIPFGDEQVRVMLDNAAAVFESYSGFTMTIPEWYDPV